MLFVVDTPRAQNPQAFMSNMLQAVSILYKTRLPMVVVFNKIDVVRHEQMLEWMDDFEKFHEVVDQDKSFASDLSRSLSLVLDEFYKTLRRAGVSAMSGEGMEELFDAIGRCRKDYLAEYWPDLRRRKEKLKAEDEKRRADALERMRRDLKSGGGARGSRHGEAQGERGGPGGGRAAPRRARARLATTMYFFW